MSIIIITLNIFSIFIFASSLEKFQNKQTDQQLDQKAVKRFRIISLFLMIISFILCYVYWQKPGWIIGINLTSINSLIITVFISYFPQRFKEWNEKFHAIFIKSA